MGIGRAFAYVKISWLAERPQWALWLPVLMGIGIAGYFTLHFEPPKLAGSALAALGLLAALAIRLDAIRIICIALTAMAVGFACAQWRTQSVQAPVIAKRAGPLKITGTVERIELTERGGRILLSGPAIPALKQRSLPDRIRLSVKGGADRVSALLPGDRVRLTAVLRPPPPPTMPGAFDFQRRAWFMGIGAYGFVLGEVQALPPPSTAPDLSERIIRRIETARLSISKRVHAHANNDGGAVAAALLTGHRSYIRDDVLRIMRDAGIAHLLAISGLHIGLVAGIVFAAVRLIAAAVPYVGLRLDAKKTAAMLAIPAAFSYAVLAGLTVPTERAFLMTGLMLAGVLIDRRALSMRNVCWAATVILLFRPESLTGPGFQMSFAAVTALIAAYSTIGERQHAHGRVHTDGMPGRAGRYLLGVALTTLIASTATAPFAIYHFQHAAAFGLIANAVAVPLAALWVMPAGVATLLAMPLGVEAGPLWVMCSGIELILSSARYLAALPGAAVDVAAPPLWSLCTVALAGLWLALWRGRWRLYALPFLVLGLCGPTFARQPDIIVDGEARMVAVLHKRAVYLTSSSRAARFELENWQKRAGQTEKPHAWLRSAARPQGRARCDADGCTVALGERLVAISLDEGTLADDCRKSWMLIATIPVRGDCRPPWGIVDRFDLWRYGTHTITFTENGPEIRTVNGERGRRPWVIRPDTPSSPHDARN